MSLVRPRLWGIKVPWPWGSTLFLPDRPKRVLNVTSFPPHWFHPWTSANGQRRVAVEPVQPLLLLIEQSDGASEAPAGDVRAIPFLDRWQQETGLDWQETLADDRRGLVGLAQVDRAIDVECLSCEAPHSYVLEAHAPWVTGPLALTLQLADMTMLHPSWSVGVSWAVGGSQRAFLRPDTDLRRRLAHYVSVKPWVAGWPEGLAAQLLASLGAGG